MSATTYLLATRDPELLRAWWVLVPSGARVVTLNEIVQGTVSVPDGLPAVVVVEESVVGELPRGLWGAPMVFVGTRDSEIFERMSEASDAQRVCLSREDSRVRLGEFLPLLEEIADRTSAVNLLSERKNASAVRVGGERVSQAREEAPPESWWDWMGDAVEATGDRDGLLSEFRRMGKRTLRTSHVIFFLAEEGGYRADRGDFFSAQKDAVAQYLAKNPAAIDGRSWAPGTNPVVELSIRQRLAAWSLRLIVPLHDNGRLLGWMGAGVRDDGQAYDAADVARAASLARLLRQMLAGAAGVAPAKASDRGTELSEKYLPGALILAVDEAAPERTPPAVRGLIADVRESRATCRLVAGPGQPFRASAGFIAETQGVWVSWEDVTDEVTEQHARARSDRLALLHDLALTLNHELGNSLVSLTALRQNPGAETNSPVLLAAIKRDIAALEAINRHLASIPTFSEVMPEKVDLRALVSAVGRKGGVSVETGSQQLQLDVAPKLVEFALEAVIDSIAENRPGLGKRELAMSVRAAGSGKNLTAVLSIRGAALVLEGILPAPQPGAPPTHGRIGVFIAKEIVALHGGVIEPGTGVNGPEIVITLRRW